MTAIPAVAPATSEGSANVQPPAAPTAKDAAAAKAGAVAVEPAVEGAAGGDPKPSAPLARKSDALARFAKKDRDLYQREQRLKASEADLAQWTEAKDLSAKDPVAFIEKFGVTYDGLTKQILGTIKPSDQVLKARLDKLEKERDDERQANQTARYEETVSRFKSDIAAAVKANPDAFELTLLEGDEGIELVHEVIAQHYSTTEEILDIDEAAKMVESHLEEDLEKRVSSKKLQSKLAARAAAQANAEKAPANRGLKTLTNKMVPSQAAPQDASQKRPMSRYEEEQARLARATALLRDK